MAVPKVERRAELRVDEWESRWADDSEFASADQ